MLESNQTSTRCLGSLPFRYACRIFSGSMPSWWKGCFPELMKYLSWRHPAPGTTMVILEPTSRHTGWDHVGPIGRIYGRIGNEIWRWKAVPIRFEPAVITTGDQVPLQVSNYVMRCKAVAKCQSGQPPVMLSENMHLGIFVWCTVDACLNQCWPARWVCDCLRKCITAKTHDESQGINIHLKVMQAAGWLLAFCSRNILLSFCACQPVIACHSGWA